MICIVHCTISVKQINLVWNLYSLIWIINPIINFVSQLWKKCCDFEMFNITYFTNINLCSPSLFIIYNLFLNLLFGIWVNVDRSSFDLRFWFKFCLSQQWFWIWGLDLLKFEIFLCWFTLLSAFRKYLLVLIFLKPVTWS